MASDPVSFDLPLFAEYDFSQHRFPEGMIKAFVYHYRHHQPDCDCITTECRTSYQKKKNNGVTWAALKKAINSALYEPIKPEILEMANQRFKPSKIAKDMAKKYNIPYKGREIAQILSEANHQGNVALSPRYIAATPQPLDQRLISDIAVTPGTQFLVENMGWSPSEVSFLESELPIHPGIHNVGGVPNEMPGENEISALREQVRELETQVGNQRNRIAELESQADFKARKATELKEENKKLLNNTAQLELYQKLFGEYHGIRRNRD